MAWGECIIMLQKSPSWNSVLAHWTVTTLSNTAHYYGVHVVVLFTGSFLFLKINHRTKPRECQSFLFTHRKNFTICTDTALCLHFSFFFFHIFLPVFMWVKGLWEKDYAFTEDIQWCGQSRMACLSWSSYLSPLRNHLSPNMYQLSKWKQCSTTLV